MQSVLLRHVHRGQNVLVAVLNHLLNRLPEADTLGHLLGYFVVLGLERIADVGLGDGVGRLSRCSPPDVYRRVGGFRQELLDAVDTCGDQHLIESGDDRSGAIACDHVGEHRHRELRALDVQVAVDQTRGQVAALGVDNLGIGTLLRRHIADGSHAAVRDGHVCWIDLAS